MGRNIFKFKLKYEWRLEWGLIGEGCGGRRAEEEIARPQVETSWFITSFNFVILYYLLSFIAV